MTLAELFGYVVQGFFSGLGSFVGTFVAAKYIIDHIDKIPSVKDKVRELIGPKERP